MTRTPVSASRSPIGACASRSAGGKVLEAEHVILTAPPSVWNRIAIDPALPAALAPQMGNNVKCLLAMKTPFWRRAELAPDILSDGPVNMTWHATDGQEGEAGGEAMVAFSGGPSADACREWGARRIDTYLAELQKIYRGIRGNYVRARFMDWPGDRWTMGGYSFPAPGQVTTQGPTLRGHRPPPLCRRAHQLRVHGLHGGRAQLGRRPASRSAAVRRSSSSR
jgi:monoamine oxidase